ncbi:MAG: hypothetical protein FH756_12010 [Firmicutes bacterium]|nr:hypothetical protein [Bacillota bacterium]
MISLPRITKKHGGSKKAIAGKNKQAEHTKCGFSPGMQVDEVEIEIEDIKMCLKRKVNLQVPHEISAIIPRAEIRKRTFEAGVLTSEEEILLNSITIVHAPRHPLAGETPPGNDQKEEQGLTPSPQNPLRKTAVDAKDKSIPYINFNFSSPR